MVKQDIVDLEEVVIQAEKNVKAALRKFRTLLRDKQGLIPDPADGSPSLADCLGTLRTNVRCLKWHLEEILLVADRKM